MRYAHLIFCVVVATICRPLPAQVQVDTVGPCTIFHVRGNVSSDSVIDACRQTPGAARTNLYGWVIPQLGYAFDQAERSQCGDLGCLGAIPVTVVIYPDALANAAVQRRADRLTLLVNTGLIDFVDATARSFNLDLKNLQRNQPPRGGYGDWMTSMVGAGGRPCGFQVTFPTPTVPAADLPSEQTVASAAYQLVFGHELSHFRTPQYQCNYAGQDDLGREMSCDRIAENGLLRIRNSTYMPVAAVAWMMAMESYERLTGPLYHNLYMGGNAPTTFEGMFPARDWKSRAQQVTETWNAFCRTGAQSALCPAGYADAISFANSLTMQRLPAQCDLGGSAQAPSVAGFCSTLKQAISLSASKFASIKGASMPSGDSRTAFIIPGFSRCTVQNESDSGTSNLYCSAPDGKFPDLLMSFKSCLNDWAERDSVNSQGRRSAVFSHIGLASGVTVWESANGGVSASVDERR